MSDTPETDATALVHSVTGASLHCVDVDFARKLERERDEARALVAEMKQAIIWAKAEAKERLHRLDQAACERRTWLEAEHKMKLERDEARAERDEARAERDEARMESLIFEKEMRRLRHCRNGDSGQRQAMNLRPFRLITILEAVKLAELRNLEGSALGCNASTTYKSDLAEFLTRNVNGILAELVVGRRFDRFYLPSCNTFHNQADVGEDIEVRSTHHLNGSLILRDNDYPDRRYVLVIVRVGQSAKGESKEDKARQGFAVKGWAYGHEVMRDEWKVADGGRPHWRYRGALRPWETLTLARLAEAEPECVW